MAHFSLGRLLKPAMMGGALFALSACAYGDGTYGDGYVNGAGYACDPYGLFDDYYACDDGYGYANIGFGGGWYDSFYYPGYGIYIFDRRGSRYAMKRHHRRHWARKRAEYGWRKDRRRAEKWRDLTPEQRAKRRDRQAERRRNLTPEQHAGRRERRAERRRNMTPEERAQRQERRAERLRNMTPEQRAERQQRRAERRERRASEGNRTAGARTGRAGLRDGAIRGQRRGEARQARRAANRQGNSVRSERRSQQARPAARQRSAPVARSTPRRSSRGEVSRRNVNDD
ncbi:hypothetical protein [Parasphingorhabdus litoris]|uniref:hypothetical protein n=1 Tax=Parasphingorhabdus litoris TaxID=394733 RepID=UPI001E4BE0CF|nr:hypothetical protein [Parasphingorhabdus litoris]